MSVLLLAVALTVTEPSFTDELIDTHAHAILTWQQAEREHEWGHAIEANRRAQEMASRARAVASSSGTASGSSTRTAPIRTSATTGTSGVSVLARIRGCESGTGPDSPGSYTAENPRSSASGAFQFLSGTWTAVTGLAPPASAYSAAVQDAAALKLYREQGTTPWNASRGCWS